MAFAAAVSDSAVVTPIPVRDIAPWAVLVTAATLVLVYFVGFEQGAFSLLSSDMVHEFVHDARHLAGLPCH